MTTTAHFLTLHKEAAKGLIEARCTCGRLLFRFTTMDPTFYVETKCGKCNRLVEILGEHFAVASSSSTF